MLSLELMFSKDFAIAAKPVTSMELQIQIGVGNIPFLEDSPLSSNNLLTTPREHCAQQASPTRGVSHQVSLAKGCSQEAILSFRSTLQTHLGWGRCLTRPPCWGGAPWLASVVQVRVALCKLSKVAKLLPFLSMTKATPFVSLPFTSSNDSHYGRHHLYSF